MTAVAPISLALAWIVGACVVHRLSRSFEDRAGGTVAIVGAGLGLGIGITTLPWFAIALGGGLSWGGVVAEVALAVVALLSTRWWRARPIEGAGHGGPPPVPREPERRLLAEWVLSAALVVAGTSFLAGFLSATLAEPHGWLDAWAIWNQHARFFIRGGPEWQRTLAESLRWSHPDYPLMLPIAVARSWFFLGSESTWVPAAIAASFVAAAAALLFGALRLLRGRVHALAGAALLLCAPSFVDNAASQCADVPMAFFVLAATTFSVLEGSLPVATRGLAALSGLAAGCAAWTKNEGVLVLGCFAAVRVVRAARNGREDVLRLAAFAAGSAPFVAAVAVLKLAFAPANDLLSGQTLPRLLDTLADPRRHAAVAIAIARVLTRDLWLPLVATAIVAAALGFSARGLRRAPHAGPAVALALVALVEYGVYVTTPKPLEWHLETSLSRVGLQIVPAILFLALAAAGLSRAAPPARAVPEGGREDRSRGEAPRGVAIHGTKGGPAGAGPPCRCVAARVGSS